MIELNFHRALKRMIPDNYPYVVRVISDILESNGSSSMATVCAGTLALRDAGVPMKKPVSGIAMGLISENKGTNYAILSDILGDEDHLGDMDFKVSVLALSIERYFALRSAFGKGSLAKFVANIKAALAEGDIKKAQEICDNQRGSVANVVTSTLRKYDEMEKNTALSKEQKLLAIQKELEEATALEMPMMQQNLPIIATITTLGTLMGLLGTVIGMIRSFAALSAGGGADSMALSQGISEALINTAFGILTGALAVISYNYYTNKIDKLTYGLDEVGFSIVQTFAATH